MALPRCRYCHRLLDGGHEPDCPAALVDDGDERREPAERIGMAYDDAWDVVDGE